MFHTLGFPPPHTHTYLQKKNKTEQDPTPSNGSCRLSSLHLQGSCPALPEHQPMSRYMWLWRWEDSCGLSVPHCGRTDRKGKIRIRIQLTCGHSRCLCMCMCSRLKYVNHSLTDCACVWECVCLKYVSNLFATWFSGWNSSKGAERANFTQPIFKT